MSVWTLNNLGNLDDYTQPGFYPEGTHEHQYRIKMIGIEKKTQVRLKCYKLTI